MALSSGYINLPVASDRDTLIQTALGNISAAMPGWRPREGNLEVLLLEQFADIATEAASVAAQVPLEIFAYYGSLLGINQNTGTATQINTTWTLASSSSADTIISSGTLAAALINATYYQFKTDSVLTIPAGSISGTVTMTAVTAGSSYNAVVGSSYLQMSYPIANLSSVQATEILIVGTDNETTDNYLDRLNTTLSLYTPRPIIANDYAGISSQVLGVGRASGNDNLNLFVNQLPVTVATPSTSGWSALNGSTIATGTTTPAGIKVTAPASTLASFTTSNTTYPTTSDSFLPFTTTALTANATSSSTTLTIGTGLTVFPNSAGVGVAYSKASNSFVPFTYTGYTTGTGVISGVSWGPVSSAVSFSSSTDLVAYMGAASFWTTQNFNGSGCTITANNIAGIVWEVDASGFSTGEAVVVLPNGSNGSCFGTKLYSSTTNIGVYTSPISGTYSGAVTIQLCAGATTTSLSISSNLINLLATVSVEAASYESGVYPVLVANVKYLNQNNFLTYYSDTTLNGSYSIYQQCLSAYIQGYSPTAYAVSDPLYNGSYYPDVSTVILSVYWANAATSAVNNITLASLNQTISDVAIYQGNFWELGENNNPGSIVPDGLFQSVYPAYASTKFNGTAGTVASLSTNLVVSSVAGWPSSGSGTFVDTTGTSHTFLYTGINSSSSTLTGCTFYPTTGSVATTTVITSLSQLTQPLQWTFTPSTYGNLYPLWGNGIQFKPNSTTTGGVVTATSSIFSLPPNTTYALDVTIDATTVTSGAPTVGVYSVNGGTLAGSSTFNVLATVGQKLRITGSFTTTTRVDAVVQIAFPSGMASPANSSVIVSNLRLTPMVGSLLGTTSSFASAVDSLGDDGVNPGPTWGPGGTYGNSTERAVSVIVSPSTGQRTSLSVLQQVSNYLNSFRETSFNLNVVGPSCAIVNISYLVYSSKGYDPNTVAANILTSLTNYISPAYWGSPSANYFVWDSSANVLRYLDVIGLISDSDGVQSIESVTIGLNGGSLGTSDLTFFKYGTLPIVGTVTASIVPSNSSVFGSDS